MEQTDMTDTTKRPRGRPSTGQAKSAATRMRAMRQRVIDRIEQTPDPLHDLPVTALLHAIPPCIKAGASGAFADVIEALVQKANAQPNREGWLILSLTLAD